MKFIMFFVMMFVILAVWRSMDDFALTPMREVMDNQTALTMDPTLNVLFYTSWGWIFIVAIIALAFKLTRKDNYGGGYT